MLIADDTRFDTGNALDNVATLMTVTQRQEPYPAFPLFPHSAGVWANKICGELRDFGPCCDTAMSPAKYEREVHDLQAGRQQRLSEALACDMIVSNFV